MVNLSPLVDGLASLALAVISAATPILLVWVNNYFKLNLDAQHRAALGTALDNALGAVLNLGQAAGDAKLANVTIKNAAIQAGVQYVLSAVPGAVAHFDLSDEEIAAKIAAKLATLLHVTNAVQQPSAVPAPETTAAMLDKLVEAQDRGHLAGPQAP